MAVRLGEIMGDVMGDIELRYYNYLKREGRFEEIKKLWPQGRPGKNLRNVNLKGR